VHEIAFYDRLKLGKIRNGGAMIGVWLALPLPALIGSIVLFFGAVAALLVWLSFGPVTGRAVQDFKGVAPPFAPVIAAVLAILIGFLASDIWDRERRAAASVRAEANQLIALDRLAATFGLPRGALDTAIRAYAETVIEKEWPSMERQQSSLPAESALDDVFKAVDGLQLATAGRADLDRVMTATVLDIRSARNARLGLSQDHSEDVKWLSVLALAVMSQVSVALVQLERAKPQIAALVVLTISLVVVIVMLASHELPFASPLAVSPAPLVHVLDVVPAA
jgi:Protein of unknown function (DUF4239)